MTLTTKLHDFCVLTVFSLFFLLFFSFLHIYSHCTQAKINSQTKKIGKKIERNTEEKNGEHAIRSNATENLSHSRIILPIFMISVVWPILLWLFTEWKMNMYTRNRDVTMFFYFHFVFFFCVCSFSFWFPVHLLDLNGCSCNRKMPPRTLTFQQHHRYAIHFALVGRICQLLV